MFSTTAFIGDHEIGYYSYNEMFDQYQIFINEEYKESVDSPSEAEESIKKEFSYFGKEITFVSYI